MNKENGWHDLFILESVIGVFEMNDPSISQNTINNKRKSVNEKEGTIYFVDTVANVWDAAFTCPLIIWTIVGNDRRTCLQLWLCYVLLGFWIAIYWYCFAIKFKSNSMERKISYPLWSATLELCIQIGQLMNTHFGLSNTTFSYFF